jgi:hypothetical protein
MKKSPDRQWMNHTTVLIVTAACAWSLGDALLRNLDALRIGVASARFYVPSFILLLILTVFFSVGAWRLLRWGRLGLLCILLLVAISNLVQYVRTIELLTEARQVQIPDYNPMADILSSVAHPLAWTIISAATFWVFYRSECARRFR